jgi:hypothetical protein
MSGDFRSTPTRRGLLAGAAALPAAGALAALASPCSTAAAAPPAVPDAGADAELIRLATEATALDRESDRRLSLIEDGLPIESAEAEALCERIDAMVNKWHDKMGLISEMPARTEAGLRAKAAIVADFFRDSSESRDLVAESLARDVLEFRWPKPGLPDERTTMTTREG